MALAMPCQCGMANQLKQMHGGYNYEDRRQRATWLMQRLEPDFDAEKLRGPFTGCPHPPPEKKARPKFGPASTPARSSPSPRFEMSSPTSVSTSR